VDAALTKEFSQEETTAVAKDLAVVSDESSKKSDAATDGVFDLNLSLYEE